MRASRILLAGPLLALAAAAQAGERATVIYDGATTQVAAAPEKGSDLWITPADLKTAAKLELKPEGVCTESVCIPLPQDRKDAFLVTKGGETRFNLSEFARLLKQPVAHDAKHGVWYFGPRPENQNAHVQNLQAPDFTLPDMDGKNHSLSDFRGKKVLLLTWGSW
jgi:hypothetical protein